MLTTLAIITIYKYIKGDKGSEVSTTVEEKRASNTQKNMMTVDWYKLLLCAVYMFAGPLLILLNKFILSNLNFPYPMFLSALGVVFSAFVARIVVMLGIVKLQRKEQVSGLHYVKRVLPVGFFHAATLSFGNLVYLYLNVGFIQMLKSFTPVIMLACSSAVGLEYPAQMTILGIVYISIGTATTCTFVPELNVTGLLIMFLSEFSEAIRLLMTQFLLQNLKFGVIEGQYVLAPAAAFWLTIAAGIFEGRRMMENDALSIIAANPLAFLVASALGLCVNFLGYLVIQATSSITMKVLATARTILTICVGVVIWGEVLGLKSIIGYAMTLCGFVFYNLSKMNIPGFVKITIPTMLTQRIPALQLLQDKLDAMDATRLRWELHRQAEQEDRDRELARQSDNDNMGGTKGRELHLEEMELKRMNVVADEAEIGLEEEVSMSVAAASRESRAPLLAAPVESPMIGALDVSNTGGGGQARGRRISEMGSEALLDAEHGHGGLGNGLGKGKGGHGAQRKGYSQGKVRHGALEQT